MLTKSIKKKKKFLPGATKLLLALTSLAGTVGLWNVISNQSLVEAQKANQTVDGPLVLPPLPTVVPLVQITPRATTESASVLPGDSTLRKVSPSTVKVPSSNLSTNAAAPVIIPGTVTTTGSSK